MHRHHAPQPFLHHFGVFADRLADRAEDDPGLFQFGAECCGDRNAVKHRIHRHLAGALDAGQHLLLLQRNAQLFVDAQDFGIDFVQTVDLGLCLGRGVVIGVLIIDRRHVQLGPIGHRHGQPVAVSLQPPFEHPFRLVLLGADEPHRVFGQTLWREICGDIRRPAVFVIGNLGGRIMRGLILEDFLGHCTTSACRAAPISRLSGTSASAPRIVSFTTAQCGRTAQACSSEQSCLPCSAPFT